MSSLTAKLLDKLTGARGIAMVTAAFAAALPLWLPQATDTVLGEPAATQADKPALPALLFPSAEAAAPSTMALQWYGADGNLYRGLVGTQPYADLVASQLAMLGGALRRQEAQLPLHVADELDAVFDPLEQRIATYADWAFNWWTSYLIAVDAMSAAWAALWQGHATDMGAIVEGAVRTSVEHRYQDIVARPDLTGPALRRAVLAVGGNLRRSMLTECGALDKALEQFLHAQVGDVERSLPTGGWTPAEGWKSVPVRTACARMVEATEPLNLDSLEMDKVLRSDGRVGEVVVRITRPLVTGLVTAGVSASSVAAALSGIGIPAAIVSAPAVVALIVKSSFTIVDYGLSEIDETLNRQRFEDTMLANLRDSRQQLEQKVVALWLAHQSRQVERIMVELRRQHSGDLGFING